MLNRTPAVEIGWRLAANHWGHGFATEGAKAILKHAFIDLDIFEVVSFTAEQNLRSKRVMQKIGLQNNLADNFEHPKLDNDSRLKKHVLKRWR